MRRLASFGKLNSLHWTLALERQKPDWNKWLLSREIGVIPICQILQWRCHFINRKLLPNLGCENGNGKQQGHAVESMST